MANIITYQYMIGALSLPHTINAEGQALVTQFITQYEFEFLEKVLGYELAKGLVDNIASAADKWKNLRDGIEFTNNMNRLDRWVGFKNETTFISPIANYIFYKMVKDGVTSLAGIGAIQPKSENAERVYPQLKLNEAWNKMVMMIRPLHEFLRKDPTTYPEFVYYRPCGMTKKINQFGI